MKKTIGLLGSYMFFYLGHWTSILMEKTDWEFLYLLYKEFMNYSLNLQYWADLDRPWKEPTEKDIENE
jgi:hypothetical protein